MDIVKIKFSEFLCQKKPLYVKDILIANPLEINVSSEKNIVCIDIHSNVEWKVVSYEGWMNLNREDLSENSAKLIVNIDKYPSNKNGRLREGSIIIESLDSSLKQEIKVTQSGKSLFVDIADQVDLALEDFDSDFNNDFTN